MGERNYYTLIVLFGDNWSPEFGDYDREVVVEEQDTYDREFKTRIICTGDRQFEITEAVRVQNIRFG